jgi:serine O-acetyltransferase
MTLPQRIAVVLKRSFAYLHPCLHGPVGGGEAADLDAIAASLRKEIEYLLPDSDPDEVVGAFIARFPEVRRMLETDTRAAYEGDPAATSRMEVVMAYPGVYAVTVHRLAHELYRLKVPIIPRVMSELAHSRTGIDIHPGAAIGERFFIDHGTGVVIGETTVIGRNVKLYQGVTLGALSFAKDPQTGALVKGIKRHPNVEDNVVIYAGATILGGTTVIGHDSEIGGNVWLKDSVPPNSRVYNKPPAPEIRTRK